MQGRNSSPLDELFEKTQIESYTRIMNKVRAGGVMGLVFLSGYLMAGTKQGLFAKDISRKSGFSVSAVYGAFNTLTSAGFFLRITPGGNNVYFKALHDRFKEEKETGELVKELFGIKGGKI